MLTTNISMCVPKEMLSYLELAGNEKVQLQRNAMLLYPLIHDLTISYGRAAEILGISKDELIELYGDMGIPYLNYGVSELEQDLLTLDSVLGETA
ncbi:MAG: UPF0175 family protein [Selenomonadaceae bacterium]|nr:UPF0175 family protein [Selenomonadaceae bacterium]